MNKFFLLVFTTIWACTALALEPWQGQDYAVESWRCGAPLIEELRANDPDNKLNDPSGQYMLKESLEKVSESNLKHYEKNLGTLSSDEQNLLALVETKFHAPIVHRTSLDVAKLILKDGFNFSSPVKRGVSARITPGIEQQLFAGWDCFFTSVASPYGIQNYGTVLVKLKNKVKFAWGSIYTGFSWTKEIAQRSIYDTATGWMKRKFSRQVFTNNHFDKAIAYQIITNIRAGSSIRSRGHDYDKSKMLKKLLSYTKANKFWEKVVAHRLGFFEAHFTDDISLNDLKFVQFRSMDMPTVQAWKLPSKWFQGQSDGFVQHYPRSE